MFTRTAIACFNKISSSRTTGQKIPGLIDQDDFFAIAIRAEHLFTNSVNHHQQNDRLQVFLGFEFLQLQHNEVGRKIHLGRAFEVFAVSTSRGVLVELRCKVSDFFVPRLTVFKLAELERIAQVRNGEVFTVLIP